MKHILAGTMYNRVGATLVRTHLNIVFLLKSNLCPACTESVELFYMLSSMLSEVCLPEQTVTWIPRKIFRISYQNLNSRFFQQSFCNFFQHTQASSYSKIYLPLGFQSVPCVCERRNMQRKKDNENIDLWIWSLVNWEVLQRKAQAWDLKNNVITKYMLTQTQLQPPLLPTNENIEHLFAYRNTILKKTLSD